jgi:hypothetical protein
VQRWAVPASARDAFGQEPFDPSRTQGGFLHARVLLVPL